MSRAKGAAAVVLALAALCAAVAAPAQPNVAGAWGTGERGCYCHTPDPSQAVGFTVTGLPGRYDAGATYTVHIEVVFTDVPAAPNRSQGGFFIQATAGHFEVPPDMAGLVNASGLEATHTLNGTRLRGWSVLWVAPNETGSVVGFKVIVNTANGNGSETFSADHWTYKRIRIGQWDTPQVEGPPPPSPVLALETFGVLAVGGAFAAYALYTFYSARKPAAPQAPDSRTRPARRRRG